MRSFIVYVLVLSVDFVAFCVLDDRLSRWSDQGNTTACLCWQWVTTGIRWVLLSGVCYWANPGSSVVVKRWLTTQCLLGSVLETGQFVLLGNYPLGTAWRWLSNVLAAASASLFWELSCPDKTDESNGKQKTQKARILFKRVILLYRPDYLLLMGAFIFLTLAVLCKYCHAGNVKIIIKC